MNFNFTKVLNINQFSPEDAPEFFTHQFIFNFAIMYKKEQILNKSYGKN
jgi:hypothetical protein